MALEVFEGADQVDDAGDAQGVRSTTAGLDGDRAERRCASLGENHAIDTRAVRYTQQGAEVLRVFDAIEGEEETGRASGGSGEGCWRLKQVFDGKKFLGAHHGDHALVRGGTGKVSQLVAR